MPAQLPDEELFAALDAEQYFDNVSEAANSLDLSPQAYRYRLNTAKKVLKGSRLNMVSRLTASRRLTCRPMRCQPTSRSSI